MSYEILHLGDQLGRSAESTAITAIVATLIALTARSLWPIPARSVWPSLASVRRRVLPRRARLLPRRPFFAHCNDRTCGCSATDSDNETRGIIVNSP